MGMGVFGARPPFFLEEHMSRLGRELEELEDEQEHEARDFETLRDEAIDRENEQ